jgi:hypothetical protein
MYDNTTFPMNGLSLPKYEKPHTHDRNEAKRQSPPKPADGRIKVN